MNGVRNINWGEIKHNYPKAFNAYFLFLNGKNEGATCDTLYAFFDSKELYGSIQPVKDEQNNKLAFTGYIGLMGYDEPVESCDTRSLAEIALFEQLFKELEYKLIPDFLPQKR